MYCKEFLSSFLITAAFFIEQLKNQSGSKTAPGKVTERFFPLLAQIAFARQQPPLVIQCAICRLPFSSGRIFFRQGMAGDLSCQTAPDELLPDHPAAGVAHPQ